MNDGGDTVQLSTANDSVCDLGEATKASKPPFPHHSLTGFKSTLREVGALVPVPARWEGPSTGVQLRGQQVAVAGSRGHCKLGRRPSSKNRA